MNGLLAVSSQPTEKSEKDKQESQLTASLNPDYPNRTARRYLAIEWKRLSHEDQVLLRAKRSRRGIKCIKCGLVGYFAENCPNGCVNHLYDHLLLDDDEEEEMKEKAKKRALKEKQLLLPSSPSKTKRKEVQKQQQKVEEMKKIEENSENEDGEDVKRSTVSIISRPDSASFQEVSNVESLESVSLFWGNTLSTVTAPAPKKKKDSKTKRNISSNSLQEAENGSIVLSTSLLKVQKLDISSLRQPSTLRLQELQETDLENAQHSFSFYNNCESNYNRNYSELTLQQVMRRVIRLVQSNLSHQTQELESTFDTTLLVPPIAKVTKTFYPSSLMDDEKNRKELREYYLKKEEENEAKKNASRLAYKSQVSLRPLDELDDFFRGKAGGGKLGWISCFTSFSLIFSLFSFFLSFLLLVSSFVSVSVFLSLNSSFQIGKNDDILSKYYEIPKNAGQSIHGKNQWKSVLARNDVLANSDPSLLKKQEKINQLFENQSKWIKYQSLHMKHCNDRYEHLVWLIQNEIEKEHEREGKLLMLSAASSSSSTATAASFSHVFSLSKEEKHFAMDLWQERLNSVDLLLKVLQSYKFIAGLEEADFLLYCLTEWKTEAKKRLRHPSHHHRPSKQQSSSSLLSPSLSVMTHSKSASSMLSPNNGGNNEGGGIGENDEASYKDGDRSVVSNQAHQLQHQQHTKGKHKKSRHLGGNNINRKDLVASSTNPYYSDLQFLSSLKRKQQRLQEKSKEGRVFTAAMNRDFIEQEKERHEQILNELEKSQTQQGGEGGAGKTILSIIAKRHEPIETAINPFEDERIRKNEREKELLEGSGEGEGEEGYSYQGGSEERSVGNYNHNHNKKRMLIPYEAKATGGASSLSLMSSLPSLEEIQENALKHKEKIDEIEEKKQKQREILALTLRKGRGKVSEEEEEKRRFIHPRDIDAQHIAEAKISFTKAELGNRIRKGNDNDLAMMLPALIPIPAAFDG
jgi:hypothetical protein